MNNDDFLSVAAGKRVLVTGGTSGIGLEAAVALARAGARVVIVGRDAARTHSAVDRIRDRTSGVSVDSLLGDFAVQASIRTLAAEYRARYDRLDILINNAGTVYDTRTLTVDGIEATFAVNHLGYVLLTELLLDLLVASAPARIVMVSSRGHYRGTMNFDDLGFEQGYAIMAAYCRSKLGNVLYTRHLARRVADKGVLVNALHPGGVATNIWTGAPAWTQPFLAVAKLFMLTPEQGGRTLTFLAAHPDVEGRSGLYFEKNRERAPAPLALDDALADRLFLESARLVGLPT